MSSSALADGCLSVAWSLWSELGVPGIARNHRQVVIDPEPIVLWSPSIIREDPRLRDLVFAWCAAHGARLSASRMRALARRLPASTGAQFAGFARTLAGASTVRWPAGTAAADWPEPTERRAVPLPMERPALLRFRLRSLAGVGARADTLHHLLAAWPDSVCAADVAATGYGKRNVSRLLAEMADAQILSTRRRGNRLEFHLRTPAMLGRLVGAGDAWDVPWVELLGVLARLLDLETTWTERPSTARRIQAHRVRSEIAPVAESVGLTPPPRTEANADAFPVLLDWGAAEAAKLANGTAATLARRSGWAAAPGTGAGGVHGYGAGAVDGSGFGFGGGYGAGTGDGDGWGDGSE